MMRFEEPFAPRVRLLLAGKVPGEESRAPLPVRLQLGNSSRPGNRRSERGSWWQEARRGEVGELRIDRGKVGGTGILAGSASV